MRRGESTAEDSLCVQICVLYYILLYEDVRLANMKNILTTGRKVIFVKELYHALHENNK